jgi:hypothetical protein
MFDRRGNHTMKMTLLMAALLAAAHAHAAPRELLPAQGGDLSAAAVVAPGTSSLKNANLTVAAGAGDDAVAPPSLAGAMPKVSRDPVSLSWATPGAAAASAATPYVAQSKESYRSVTADELAAGVTLNTTAPRALVRLQVLSSVGPREQAAIHPLAMTVIDPAGRSLASGDGMEMIVSADKLAKADVPFAPGTSAFRLHPSLGAGKFKLKVDGASGSDRYLINVVEPDSPYTLTMQTAALHYLHGNELVLQSELQDGTGKPSAAKISKLEGYVISPAGRRFPVSFKTDATGRMRASLVLDADEAPVPGLWEIRAEASGKVKDQAIERSVRLAFPVAMPVARLTRGVVLAEGAGVNLEVGVETAAAGRYEVRGMLYGTVNGVLKPLGVADSAQWLEAGEGKIALGFAPELIAGASGPFELRDLFLLDQGRLGVLHRQQRALVIGEDEVARAGGRATAKAAIGVSVAPAAAPRVKRAPNAAAQS